MDKFKLYIIENITNMHVGNGDINFNIIDNEVQRDVITRFPTINPSSLKGSLRAFCKNRLTNEEIKTVFGDDEKGTGEYKFFSASLLSIPVRSNVRPFFRAICPLIIEEFVNMLIDFKEENNLLREIAEKLRTLFSKNSYKTNEEEIGFLLSNTNSENVKIEGYKVANIGKIRDNKEKYKINTKEIKELEKIFGENLVVINDVIFSNIVRELPIMARNKLENGESKNLWYEEVVPRKTRFYFGIIQCSEYRENKKYKTELNEKFDYLIKNNMIQFGANATIGYGYCKIYELGDENE